MVELSLGFSWNGIIKIIDQLYSNQRIIYQAKTDADSKNEVIFTISIYKKEFFCSVKIKDDDIFILSAGNINETGINNRYIFLSCEMTIQNGTAKISIWINNQKIGTVEQEVPDIVYTPLTKQVIGGSVEGKDSAAFFLRELILVNKCLNDDEKIKLSKYFWMQFIKEEYLDYI